MVPAAPPVEEPFAVMDADPARRMALAIEDIRQGRMVILVDDEDRENEGDLVMAASRVTPEAINFMATYARGLICLPLTEQRVAELDLPMAAARNRGRFGTGFTVPIEARRGVTTGISAQDRAHTIRVAIDPASGPDDLETPGHVFPLKARDGGVLVRTGQTEGSVDLARLAGLYPAGVICEVMNEDGTMARLPDLERFGALHRLRVVTVEDIIRWRLRHERTVELVLQEVLPVRGLGDFDLRVYRTTLDSGLHFALSRGDLGGEEPPLVRVQTACLPGDVFHGLTCDCGAQLQASLEAIAAAGRGVLLYLHPDDSSEPEALLDRLRAHLRPRLPEVDEPVRTGEAALRGFGIGAQVLRELGVHSLRLLTNNPRKIVCLEGFGLRVAARVSLAVAEGDQARAFLDVQRRHLGHLLPG
ncbi:MAG: 3,4-dihydroxy-2-butanone-4-phosphate synthase [Pseudomonadota bacterium]